MTRKSKKQCLQIIHSDCAGIDIGSREHWVAVDPDKAEDPVRRANKNLTKNNPNEIFIFYNEAGL